MDTIITFCFSAGRGVGEFSDSDYASLKRIIHLISVEHGFDYHITHNPKQADIAFFHERVPSDWSVKDKPYLPQIIISSTCLTCVGPQHDTPWGQVESLISILANTILHQRKALSSLTFNFSVGGDDPPN